MRLLTNAIKYFGDLYTALRLYSEAVRLLLSAGDGRLAPVEMREEISPFIQ